MPIINEDRLAFHFPDNWRIIKYDDAAFYRNTIESIGADMCAVDFIASPSPDFSTLLLIEVKDFRGYAVENRKRLSSGELVIEVIRKALHTLSALYLSAYTGNTELQPFHNDNLLPPQRMELILFMENDDETGYSKLRIENSRKNIADMEFKLKRLKLRLKISTRILSIARLKDRDGFTVSNKV